MDTVFTVVAEHIQINTSQLVLTDVFITINAGDEFMLETWTTDEDFG